MAANKKGVIWMKNSKVVKCKDCQLHNECSLEFTRRVYTLSWCYFYKRKWWKFWVR